MSKGIRDILELEVYKLLILSITERIKNRQCFNSNIYRDMN